MNRIDLLTLGLLDKMESSIAQIRMWDLESDSYIFSDNANDNLTYLERSLKLLANANLRSVWSKRIGEVRLAIAESNPNYK